MQDPLNSYKCYKMKLWNLSVKKSRVILRQTHLCSSLTLSVVKRIDHGITMAKFLSIPLPRCTRGQKHE